MNFDINDILTNATSDFLLQKKVKRTLTQDAHYLPKEQVHFNESAVEKGNLNIPTALLTLYLVRGQWPVVHFCRKKSMTKN